MALDGQTFAGTSVRAAVKQRQPKTLFSPWPVTRLSDKQIVDDFARIDFGGVGQVQIDHRRLQTRMPEEFLDRFEGHAGFQEMRSVRMS